MNIVENLELVILALENQRRYIGKRYGKKQHIPNKLKPAQRIAVDAIGDLILCSEKLFLQTQTLKKAKKEIIRLREDEIDYQETIVILDEYSEYSELIDYLRDNRIEEEDAINILKTKKS